MRNKSVLDKPIGSDISGEAWVIDEDDMVSDLDTKVPTQQSVKAYVDEQGGLTEGTVIALILGLGG